VCTDVRSHVHSDLVLIEECGVCMEMEAVSVLLL
jgi:hypothetical protein